MFYLFFIFSGGGGGGGWGNPKKDCKTVLVKSGLLSADCAHGLV